MQISQNGMRQANDLSNNVAEISKVDERDNVRISIEKMLKELPPASTQCNIFQVPNQLRKMYPTAYDPHVISIGPFHCDRSDDFKFMKQYKLQGLVNFLHRMNKKMESSKDTDKNASLEDTDKNASLEEVKNASLDDTDKNASLEDTEKNASLEEVKNASLNDTDKNASLDDTDKNASLEDTDASASLEDMDKIVLEDILKTKSLKDLVEEAHTWVEKARKCYEDSIKMDKEKFVQVMLVDGCFLVELFILNYRLPLKEFPPINYLFYEVKYLDIYADLTKLENQLPFFVLQNLFNLISKGDKGISFIELTFEFFSHAWGGNYELPSNEILSKKSPEHFVDVLSFYFDPKMSPDIGKKQDENSKEKNNSRFFCLSLRPYMQKILSKILPKRFVDSLSFYFEPNMSPNIQEKHVENSKEKNSKEKNSFLRFLCFFSRRHRQKQREDNNEENQLIPPSITELCEAGVTLKKAENAKSMVDIRFKNGVLEIPPLRINNYFETIMRNLIAFEQFHPLKRKMYVTQYLLFMDYLISTKQDVNLLVKAGIMINDTGTSDKEISELFNNHFKFVTFLVSDYYEDIINDLHEHCSRSWNKSKASLKQNYFNTPWAVISLFAATLLIMLTVIQTIFSGISTHL